MIITLNIILIISLSLLFLYSYKLIAYEELVKKRYKYRALSCLMLIYTTGSSIYLIEMHICNPVLEAVKFAFIFLILKHQRNHVISDLKVSIINNIDVEMENIRFHNVRSKQTALNMFKDLKVYDNYGYFNVDKNITAEKLELILTDKSDGKSIIKTVYIE